MNFSIKRLLKTKHRFILIRNKSTSTSEYCLNSLKQYDYENFICTLLMKNTARSCALAVRSFNIEVSRAVDQVSQPSIGLMRLQFWEEALEKCYNKKTNIPQHPVALELHKVLKKIKLSKRYFQNLINSRKEYLTNSVFTNLDAIEKYSEKSVSSVYYLLLEGCNVNSVHADHAASHLGKAQGIVQQLRSLTLARQLNMVTIPQDILIKHKISHEEILRGKGSEQLNDCTFEVATRAHQHLMKARSLLNSVPVEGRCALLPAVPVNNYLKRLEKANYDIFHPTLKHRKWIWLPQLWLTHFKNKY